MHPAPLFSFWVLHNFAFTALCIDRFWRNLELRAKPKNAIHILASQGIVFLYLTAGPEER